MDARVGLSVSMKKIVDSFEMWCERRLLRIPSTAERTNTHVLDIIKLEMSLESNKLN
jgi:hypothetical protein